MTGEGQTVPGRLDASGLNTGRAQIRWLADAQALLTAGLVTSDEVRSVPGTLIHARDIFGPITLGGPPGQAG